MNIVLGSEFVKDIDKKYLILELDTFRVKDQEPVTSYCLIDTSNIVDLLQYEQWSLLHSKLIENYRKQNWNFCNQALEHLSGKWRGQLDSFYDTMQTRVSDLSQKELPADWDGYIDR